MDTLNFDVTANDSSFIEKTEQIRSAMHATALDMEEYEQRISSSFQQIADNANWASRVVEDAIKNMQREINNAIVSLSKVDAENQLRLADLQGTSGTLSNNDTEISSRKTLSIDVGDQYNELAQLNAELLIYQQKIELASKELASLRSELTLVCNEMEQMRDAGMQNTEVYSALQDKAISLTDAITTANKELVNAPISADSFTGVISGLNGIAGGLSAATSMMGLFSTENETLQKIMQKVQLAIAVTNGLQAVNTALSKDSAFQINIVGRLKLWWRSLTLQAAAAQGIETVAATTGTAANMTLAGSFRAVGLAIASIPVFGWIVTIISALIGAYALWSSKTEEQQEKQNELNESVKEFNDSVQNHAAKPVAMIELLSTKFKALGNDVEAQKKFITDNKKVFDELGVSINNVKDAQQLLIDNKDNFIEAQIAKAMSLAYTEKMQEEAKKYVEAKSAAGTWQKVGEMKDNGTLNDDGSRYDKEVHKQYLEKANDANRNMNYWGKMAFASSMKENSLMAGLPTKKAVSTSGASDNKDKIKDAHKKHLTLLEQQKLELEHFMKESADRMEQSEIDALADGAEKKMRQLELNQKKEREAFEKEIEEQKKQRREKARAVFEANEDVNKAEKSTYVKKEFNVDSVDVEDIDNEFRERNADLNTKHLNERRSFYESERQAMDEYLKELTTYEEKRKAIIAQGEMRSKGKDENERRLIQQDTNKSLTNLDVKETENSIAFTRLFSDAKDRSVKDIRTIIEESKKALEFIKGGNWDEAQGIEFGIRQESFEALQNAPGEIVKIEKNIQELNEQADAGDTAFNKMAIGFEKLFTAGSDSEKLANALGEIESAINEVMQATQFLSNSLASLGDAFGNDTLSGIAEGMNVAMDAANSALSGAKLGNAMFGPWGAAAGAAIGLVSSLGSSLAKLHDAKHEKNIQQIQKQIEVLEKSYEKLGDSLDTAFSKDASKLIEQQNILLEQQKVQIQNQIAEEKDKKKTDWDRIEEYEDRIEAIDKLIGENEEKAVDVIFGEDLKAAIENFAQAYADAWSAGDDRAKSSKDLVKNMIKQMISEAIKAASSEPMEKLRQKLAGFFSDNIISNWEKEQIEKDVEALMKDLDNQFEWADEYMKPDKDSTSQESTKGGFTSMSQDTGNELNGRFTALQISNEEIKNSMYFVLGNLSSLCTTSSNNNFLLIEMRNLAVMSNSHLEDIAKHTKVLLGFGEKLDNIDHNTKSLTSK